MLYWYGNVENNHEVQFVPKSYIHNGGSRVEGYNCYEGKENAKRVEMPYEPKPDLEASRPFDGLTSAVEVCHFPS